jgi:hypothetical protein
MTVRLELVVARDPAAVRARRAGAPGASRLAGGRGDGRRVPGAGRARVPVERVVASERGDDADRRDDRAGSLRRVALAADARDDERWAGGLDPGAGRRPEGADRPLPGGLRRTPPERSGS